MKHVPGHRLLRVRAGWPNIMKKSSFISYCECGWESQWGQAHIVREEHRLHANGIPIARKT